MIFQSLFTQMWFLMGCSKKNRYFVSIIGFCFCFSNVLNRIYFIGTTKVCIYFLQVVTLATQISRYLHNILIGKMGQQLTSCSSKANPNNLRTDFCTCFTFVCFQQLFQIFFPYFPLLMLFHFFPVFIRPQQVSNQYNIP